MDLNQIELVRSSWLQLKERSDYASHQFYQHLFQLEPELESLFNGDRFEQGRTLMMMLNAITTQLDNLPQLELQLRQLGERHRDYGVLSQDYAAFEQALLLTLQQNLGSCFNVETQQAWKKLFEFIRQRMLPQKSEALSA